MKPWSYPPIPPPQVQLTEDGAGIPNDSGVYFVYDPSGSRIEYVGQSVNLNSRVRPSHTQIEEGEWIGWVVFDEDMLNFAEAYYIGVCRPPRNFGMRGTNGRKQNPTTRTTKLVGEDERLIRELTKSLETMR